MVNQRYDTASRFVASIVGAKPDLTKTQLQKICYLLQEFGQSESQFRFIMYHYGPYSRDVTRTMRYLEDFGVIVVSEDEDGFGFHINPGTYFDEASEKLKAEQSALVHQLGDRQSWELELIATAHFVRRILRAHVKEEISRERLIDEVHTVKPLYEKDAIARAIDELAALECEFRPEPATV
jgi:uncharacterized protein YwgA